MADKKRPVKMKLTMERLDERVVPAPLNPSFGLVRNVALLGRFGGGGNRFVFDNSPPRPDDQNGFLVPGNRFGGGPTFNNGNRGAAIQTFRVNPLATRFPNLAARFPNIFNRPGLVNFGRIGRAAFPPVNPTPQPTTPTPAPNIDEINNGPLAPLGQKQITIHQEFVAFRSTNPTGTFVSSQSGLVRIEGDSVGVDIRAAGDFNALVTTLTGLGMQIQFSDPNTRIVEGLLPIAQLPAIAGSPLISSVNPVFVPALQSGGLFFGR
jgi:hypothetical protein